MSLLNNIDLWEKIIYELNGTCDSMEHVLEHCEALDLQDHMPFLNYLDNQIFLCESCGWWHPISEMADNDNWECRNCAPEDDE